MLEGLLVNKRHARRGDEQQDRLWVDWF